MKLAALLALSAILGYACFERAGVEPAVWNPCVAAIGTVAAAYFLTRRRESIPGPDRLAAFCALAVAGIAALQLAPLPLSVVRLASPARAELLRAAAPVAGGPPRFAALSVAPYATAQAILLLAGCVTAFFLVRDLASRLERTWAVVWPLLAVAGLEGLLGFLQAYGVGDAQASGTYNSRDHYAGLMEMALPLAVMYALAILRRNRRREGTPAGAAVGACAMLSLGALSLIATVFSLSRMGFFCALIALAVSGLLTFTARGWRADRRTAAPRWRRALPAAIVASAIAAGLVFLPTDPLIARFSDLASTNDITADTRVQLWRDTTPLVKDYLWFGCGFGAYESCFLKYKSVAPMNTADFAHNDYLQGLAELGIFGFAAGVAFVLRILAVAGRRILYARTLDERYRAIACVAAMAAMLAHSFVDFNMYVPANALVFAWIAGIANCAPDAAPAPLPLDADAEAEAAVA
jgi:O-antigen ligase